MTLNYHMAILAENVSLHKPFDVRYPSLGSAHVFHAII